MNKYLFFTAFLFLIFNVTGFPTAQDRYVNDYAGVLTSEQSNTLKILFSIVEENTTAEVVFVSLENTSGEDISKYSTELGDAWKIGKADKDNGLLILYIKEGNKIWVATGYGLEGILPDSKIGRMLDENYVPLRDSGNVSGGIIEFSYAVSQVLVDNSKEITSGMGYNPSINWNKIYLTMVLIVFIIIVFSIVNSGRGGSGWLFIPIFFGRSGGFSGGGFGGGGGGFGGGGFGGGGAGR